MARTWGRKRRGKLVRNDPFTKVDALAARRVLRDAYRARNELAKAFESDVAATHRLRWVTVITLLRAVGHALDSVDVRRRSRCALGWRRGSLWSATSSARELPKSRR